MVLTQIETYPVAHGKGEGSGGGTTIINGGQSSTNYDSVSVNTINAQMGNIDYIKSTSIGANNIATLYLQATNGTIQKIAGDTLDYKNGHISSLGTDEIKTKRLQAEDINALNAFITSLQSERITTEYLTVTKQAHFFELIIDKIRSVGGQLILTPASCEVDYVYGVDENGNLLPIEAENMSRIVAYDIFWRATESDGHKVTNDFRENDQVICQSFNNANVGTSYDVSNKYYWRLVTDVLSDINVNLTTGALSDNINEETQNNYTVIMKSTQSKDSNNNIYDNNIPWKCHAQTVTGLQTNVAWTNGTLDTGEAVHGTFLTASQLYGIQITPSISTDNLPVTEKLEFNIKQMTGVTSFVIPKKINIGVYFTDDSFMIFNSVGIDNEGNVTLNLSNPSVAIEAISIVSTDDVNWHMCHRIRVSDTVKAYNVDKGSVIPSAGDNLVQLGYRGNDDPNRQSAIIISAYQSPDGDLTAPSYAHYQGINDFNLGSHRGSYFDANGAKFIGDITFANIGDMTAKEKWMKLSMVTPPILCTMNENGSRSISPNVYTLNITSVDDRKYIEDETTHEMVENPNYGNTIAYNTVPTGYTLFRKCYTKDNFTWDAPALGAGSSLVGLSAFNFRNFNDGGVSVSKNFIKIENKLVKGNISTDNVIDILNVDYDEQKYWKTDSWCLIPHSEVAYATILDRFIGGNSENTQNVNLYVNLQYGAGHYKDGVCEEIAFNNTTGLSLVAHVYGQYTNNGYPLKEYTAEDDIPNNITWTKSNSNKLCSFVSANYLAVLWPDDNTKWDYMDNYKNNRFNNPVLIQVELKKGDEILDSRTVYVSMQSGAIQKLTQNSWVSAISESKTYTNSQTGPLGEAIDVNSRAIQNNTSLIYQTATGIRTWVSENYATTGQLSAGISGVNDRITSTVESLESEINQTAYGITSAVNSEFSTVNGKIDGITGAISDINGEITGINGEITGINGRIDGITGAITGDMEALAEVLGTKINQTAGMLRSEAKRSYWHSGSHLDSSDPSTTIDLTSSSYDQNRYYCVTITPSDHSYTKKHVYNFQVERDRGTEANWGKPNWGSQSEPYGVDLMLNWTIITGAGNTWTDAQKYVNEYFLQWATGKVIGDIGIDASNYETYFYVRGGSKYVVRYSEAATVSILSNDYDTSVNEPVIYTPTESTIEQTAERISMYVVETEGVTPNALRRTGIDITNGKIELNAENTDINGNLNLKNAETGFTLYDANGNARVNITADNTPNPTSADSNFSANNWKYLTSPWATKSPSTQVNATTTKYSIGTYTAGAKINMTIKPWISGTLRDGGGISCNPPNCTCVVRLYKDGNYSSAAYSTSQYVLRQIADNGYEYASFNWNLTNVQAGTYEVEINITASESADGYRYYNVSASFSYSKIVESLIYLGLDGILIGASNKHYAKIAKDAYELRWTGITGDTTGGGAIKMSDAGFQRSYSVDPDTGPVSWVGFDGYCPLTVLQSTDFINSAFYYGDSRVTAYNYKVQANDSIIIIPQDFRINMNYPDIYIRLGDGIGGVNPNQSVNGRKIIIRNLSSCTLFICVGSSSNSQYILDRNDISFIDKINAEKHSYTMLAIPQVMSNGDYCYWSIIHRD